MPYIEHGSIAGVANHAVFHIAFSVFILAVILFIEFIVVAYREISMLNAIVASTYSP